MLRIGGISCGSSGLATIAGDAVLTSRWCDLTTVLGALGADIAVLTGCRQPVAIKSVMPEMTFDCIGPLSSAFDAVCALVPPQQQNDAACQWRPDLSDSSRIFVATTNVGLILIGAYVPPQNENHDMKEPLDFLEEVFKAAKHARKQMGGGG